MIREVRFTSFAKQDLLETAQYYAQIDRSLGSAFIDTTIDFSHSLADNPLRYREVIVGIRQAVMQRFNQLIFYSAEEETLVVVAIVSSRRDPGYIERILSGR